VQIIALYKLDHKISKDDYKAMKQQWW